MPDIDALMQEWPPQLEEILKETGIPTADFDCDVATYVDIICALLGMVSHKMSTITNFGLIVIFH